MANIRSIIDVIETVMGKKLTERGVGRLKYDYPLLSRLNVEIDAYYRSAFVPQKKVGEIRPYLSTRLVDVSSVTNRYFDSKLGDLEAYLKRILLYGHGVVIYDPLPPRLDFCHPGSDKYCKENFPFIKNILLEYARLRPLIKKGIIITISDPILYKETYSTVFEARLLENYFESELDLPHGVILDMVSECLMFRNEVDYFFNHAAQYQAYEKLLGLSEEIVTSRQLQEPFKLGILGSAKLVDVSKLSPKDILSLRSDEVLFRNFRARTSEILEDVSAAAARNLDVSEDLQIRANDAFASFNDDLLGKTRKSKVLNVAGNGSVKIAAGFFAGAASSALLSGAPLLGGVAGAILPAAQGLRETAISIKNRRRRIALENHVLAITGSQT